MKKFLFSHSLLAKNKAALNRSKLTLASRLLYMSTEVANRAERASFSYDKDTWIAATDYYMHFYKIVLFH